MTKGQRQDFLREIRRSRNRYLSILFIVLLGVAFFTGLRSSEAAMKRTADVYLDRQNFMHIRVISTMGLTEEDRKAIEEVRGVEQAEGIIQMDVLTDFSGRQQVVNVFTVPEDIGQLYVTEGRLPLKEGECILDDALAASGGFSLGDEITLYSGTEKELSEDLRHETFTVVGKGKNPYYLTFERGTASVGNGSQAGFMAVQRAEFVSEIYTQIYVTVTGAREEDCYSQEYLDHIEEVKESIQAIAGERCRIRYDEVVGEAERKIQEAEEQLSDGKAQLDEGWKALAEGEEELNSGEEEYEKGLAELQANEALLEEGKEALAAGKAELAAGEAQLQEARIQVVVLETVLGAANSAYAEESELYYALVAQLALQKTKGREDLEAWLKENGLWPEETSAPETTPEETTPPESETPSETNPAETPPAETPSEPEETEPGSTPAETTPEETLPEETEPQTPSGETDPPTEAPTEAPTAPPTEAPTQAPTQPPTQAPTSPPTEPPTEPPTDPPTEPPTNPPTEPPQTDPPAPVQPDPPAQPDAGEEIPAELPEDPGELRLPGSRESLSRRAPGSLLLEAPALMSLRHGNAMAAAPGRIRERLAGNLLANRILSAGRIAAEEPAPADPENALPDEPGTGLPELPGEPENPGTALSELPGDLEELREGLESVSGSLQEAMESLAAAESGEGETTAPSLTLEDVYAYVDEGTDAVLAQFQNYLAQQKAQLDAYTAQAGEGRAQLNAAQAQLQEAQLLIAEKEAELRMGELQLEAGRLQLEEARKQLDDGWAELEENRTTLTEAQAEFDRENADALSEIAGARKEIAKVEDPEWYVLNRDTIQTYVEFGQDAESIAALSQVFPAIFFLVAALVSLTSMTRMVEEERIQIGTMKALGYGKLAIMSKYLLYALTASLIGGVFGVLVGGKLLPFIIITAYKIMYENLMGMEVRYQLGHGLLAVGLAVGCTTFATFFACYRELMAFPAELMRPAAPKQGKRVFLEHLGPVWRHMNFSAKSTVRNLMRYKKRIFMTVFGIGACMGLLLVGFGIRDSLTQIVDNQYATVWTYDAYIDTDKRALPEEKEELELFLAEDPVIASSMSALSQAYDFETGETPVEGTLTVLAEPEKRGTYLSLHDRITGEEFPLTDEGVVLTEKLARLLGVEAGDTIYLKESETTSHPLRVTAVAEHYLRHYVYMTPALYREVFGKDPVWNQKFLDFTEVTEENEERLSRELLSLEAVQGVHLTSGLSRQVRSMLRSLDLVVIVLIVSAGLLAFVVLYNLNSINIAERRRELATLKVLGFFDREVAMYVYRENVILTVLGIIAGVFMGIALHRYLIRTVEIDSLFFGRNIYRMSFVYGTILTIVFAVIVNVSMYYQLKRIDMVESLKSVE